MRAVEEFEMDFSFRHHDGLWQKATVNIAVIRMSLGALIFEIAFMDLLKDMFISLNFKAFLIKKQQSSTVFILSLIHPRPKNPQDIFLTISDFACLLTI